jgi:hypothetical protein
MTILDCSAHEDEVEILWRDFREWYIAIERLVERLCVVERLDKSLKFSYLPLLLVRNLRSRQGEPLILSQTQITLIYLTFGYDRAFTEAV